MQITSTFSSVIIPWHRPNALFDLLSATPDRTCTSSCCWTPALAAPPKADLPLPHEVTTPTPNSLVPVPHFAYPPTLPPSTCRKTNADRRGSTRQDSNPTLPTSSSNTVHEAVVMHVLVRLGLLMPLSISAAAAATIRARLCLRTDRSGTGPPSRGSHSHQRRRCSSGGNSSRRCRQVCSKSPCLLHRVALADSRNLTTQQSKPSSYKYLQAPPR
jgi:hypothetical protein